MLLQFNDNKSKEYGTATLIRKDETGRKINTSFRYEQIGPRTFTYNDPTYGKMNIHANQSIKTTEELHFINGDKIRLDTLGITLTVGNVSKQVNMKQLPIMSTDYSVEYILDLEVK